MKLTPELKASLHSILSHPFAHTWTVQGFGMLRTYLGKDETWRLNVWDDALRVHQQVSDIHTHPWDFESLVVVGQIHNVRYQYGTSASIRATHWRKLIKTGEVGGGVQDAQQVVLTDVTSETYVEGEVYSQHKAEIHRTRAIPGTVTLNWRSQKDEASLAYVFDKEGRDFIGARPRPAETHEIETACLKALARF